MKPDPKIRFNLQKCMHWTDKASTLHNASTYFTSPEWKRAVQHAKIAKSLYDLHSDSPQYKNYAWTVTERKILDRGYPVFCRVELDLTKPGIEVEASHSVQSSSSASSEHDEMPLVIDPLEIMQQQLKHKDSIIATQAQRIQQLENAEQIEKAKLASDVQQKLNDALHRVQELQQQLDMCKEDLELTQQTFSSYKQRAEVREQSLRDQLAESKSSLEETVEKMQQFQNYTTHCISVMTDAQKQLLSVHLELE